LKLKLDENLGHRARTLLEAAGHDVADFLERLFGRRVDLVIRGSIKPLLLPRQRPVDTRPLRATGIE
jgi:predicted nucleotidyltransferase